MSNIKVVSLFSGVGGLDYGFAKLGCEIVFANDFNRFACETYRHNFNRLFGDSKHLLEGDINKYWERIPEGADLLLAGAPCQTWSTAGNRKGFDDKRGELFLKTIDIIGIKKPRFIILENVTGLLSHEDGQSFDLICRKIADAGYDLTFTILDFSEYGIPQKRKRIIIWGRRRDITTDLETLIPPRSLHRPLPLGRALSANASLIMNSPNHNISQGSKEHIDYGPILRPGENIAKIKTEEIHRRFISRGLTPPQKIPGGFRPVYRLSPYEVAPTMVFRGGTNVPWHPWEDRCISVAEAAIIQGFPPDFEFKGKIQEQYKQIANAVPPMISAQLAKAFLTNL